MPVPTPFNANPSGAAKAAERTFIDGASISATGIIRKGKYAGKTLQVTIDPYYPANTDGPIPTWDAAHGGAGLTIVDTSTGGVIAKVTTGVARSIRIGYGYYVFVVGGSSDASSGPRASASTIAWSEDCLQWNTVELGAHCQVNAVVVGPRPPDKQKSASSPPPGSSTGTPTTPASGPPDGTPPPSAPIA